MDKLKLIDEYFQSRGQGYELILRPMGYHYFKSLGYKTWANNLEGLLDTVIRELKIY